jgi:D-proline reductase (dithiol) PrdB
MAHLSDLQLKYRALIQGYPFRRVDWRPGACLMKPLSEARVALITTAGFYLPGQTPFDQSFRHNDCSYREIPWGTSVDVADGTFTFDRWGSDAWIEKKIYYPLRAFARTKSS